MKNIEENGITLIVLVITIVILLILASITLSIAIGDSGILTDTKDAVNEWNRSQGEEQESFLKLANRMKEKREKRERENLKPLLSIQIIDITRNTITVKADGRRMEEGEYSYYIKEIDTGEEYELKESKKENEYTFEGLKYNTEYQIKVIAKNPYGEDERESRIIRTEEAYEVTYNINTDDTKIEVYGKGESVLETSFTPEITGWEFIGWREDNLASGEVISKKIMEGEKITLYAVFKQEVTLSYNANGGSSTPAKQTDNRYYNNGNAVNPTFTLAAAISRGGYTFSKWRLNSTSGTAYNAKGSITLSANATMYATWTTNQYYIFMAGTGFMNGYSIKVLQQDSGAYYTTSSSAITAYSTSTSLVAMVLSFNKTVTNLGYSYLYLDYDFTYEYSSYSYRNGFLYGFNDAYSNNSSDWHTAVHPLNNSLASRNTIKIPLSGETSLARYFHLVWKFACNSSKGGTMYSHVYNIYLSNS